MKKEKFKTNTHVMCLTIPVEADEYLKKFILDNAHMRNIIRNDFAEEANKYKGDFNMYYDFSPRDFKNDYYNGIEEPNNRYSYHCVGLSEQVMEDFSTAKKTVQTKNKKLLKYAKENGINFNDIKFGEFHFKKFDQNRYCFRVKLKHSYKDNCLRVRFIPLDSRTAIFKVRSNRRHRPAENIKIKFKYPIYDNIINDGIVPTYIRYYKSNDRINGCTFNLLDIKDIAFKYELGNYYVQLFIEAQYLIDRKSLKHTEGKVAGIDTGIRHPVTIYDGKNTMYISMDDKTSRKIHYLERRLKRLQHHRDIKYDYNMKHGLDVNSNNIFKLNLKIRKLHKRISNIKRFWIKNTCKKIVTTYRIIVVDDYEWPNANENKDLPTKTKRHINYVSRFHNMSFFNEYIKYAAVKYGCEYIKSPEDTTRTCCICGHVNQHPTLDMKYIKCESCGNEIERDMNAAKNCYEYAFN